MQNIRKLAIAAVLVLVHAVSAFGSSFESSAERPDQPLKWRSKIVPIAISTSLLRPAPNVKSGSDIEGALRRSLRTWEEASGIEFRVTYTDRQSVSQQTTGDGVSLVTIAPTAENVLLFSKNTQEVAATTRVYYDGRGRITEADIVLNPYQQFSSDGTFGSFDLESTLTHEIGHVLGLDHSPMRGSVMYDNFAKNGLFGIQGFLHRTLSEMDRISVRIKYGQNESESECCGLITTRLTFPEGKPAAGVEVWAEESETGRVVAQGITSAEGQFEFAGLKDGEYSLYSARKERLKRSIPAQFLGDAVVGSGESGTLTKKLESGPAQAEMKLTGLNGQLTFNSVPINSGKSYTIYVGGANLDGEDVSISFSSPLLVVLPGSLTKHDYGPGLSVLSFEVAAAPNTPIGEYSIFVEVPGAGRAAVVGGIAVREFTNPYSNLVFAERNF